MSSSRMREKEILASVRGMACRFYTIRSVESLSR